MIVGVLLLSACGNDAKDTPRAQPPASSAPAGPTQVTVTATEYSFDLPDELPAGPTSFTLTNAGKEKHFLEIVQLTDDALPLKELLKLQEDELAPYFVGQPNRIATVKPGETSEPKNIDLVPARYAYVCFIEAKDGTPHAFLGMSGEFTVH
jgi:hypothetical protein